MVINDLAVQYKNDDMSKSLKFEGPTYVLYMN